MLRPLAQTEQSLVRRVEVVRSQVLPLRLRQRRQPPVLPCLLSLTPTPTAHQHERLEALTLRDPGEETARRHAVRLEVALGVEDGAVAVVAHEALEVLEELEAELQQHGAHHVDPPQNGYWLTPSRDSTRVRQTVLLLVHHRQNERLLLALHVKPGPQPLSPSLHGGTIHRLPLGHLAGVHGADSLRITRRVGTHEQRVLGGHDGRHHALETLLRLSDECWREGETVQRVVFGRRDLVVMRATQPDGHVVDVHHHAALQRGHHRGQFDELPRDADEEGIWRLEQGQLLEREERSEQAGQVPGEGVEQRAQSLD